MSLRILVAEDEALIAMQIEMDLEDAGYSVVGPCLSLDDCMKALKTEKIDAAVLEEIGVLGGHHRAERQPHPRGGSAAPDKGPEPQRAADDLCAGSGAAPGGGGGQQKRE